MTDLLKNLDKLHTTAMGLDRIRKNLRMEEGDAVQWCKDRIRKRDAKIEQIGKNWYITADGCRITVNSHSYTIITAHRTR